MTTSESLAADMSRLAIASPTHPPTESLFRRQSSSASSDDSYQSGATCGSQTTASSCCPEDFEADGVRQRKKSTVIHEEDAESPLSLEQHDAAATPPESPILPPDTIPKPHRILQPVEHELPYTHATMPWDKFYSSRADYPASMFDLFLAYHRGPLDTLHDLGAGSGLAADGLLTALRRRSRDDRLPRTILSDPGEENLGITARFVAARHPEAVLECWRAQGEHQDLFLVPSSVDMTIVAEALHWMDMPSAISQAANSLRSGGTLAIVLYSCFPRILNNAHVKKALRALVEDHLSTRLLKDPDSPDTSPSSPSSSDHHSSKASPTSPTSAQIAPNWARGMRALAYGLDAVALPADQWEGIQRHEINCGATGWWWPSASKDILGCAPPMADASPHERLVYESYEDWGRWAGLRELKELLVSIQVGFGEKTWESELWKEVERAVKGPLHFVWQVHMVIARKKSPGLETVAEES